MSERAFDAAELLHQAARQLGESLDPERVYDRFHELVEGVIPHNGLVVSSYDASTGVITCEYAWVDGAKLDPATLPPLEVNRAGGGMQSRVILSGEGLLANDVAERVESGAGRYYDVDSGGGVRKVPESGRVSTRAALMTPVKHAGRVVGVVQLMSEDYTYTQQQLELMEGIVAQMSAAVRNARLYRAAEEELEARARAEAALRESEARLRAIFDTAAAGIAEVGLDGRWLSVNDRLCEITGYSRDELLQLGYQDITPPEEVVLDRKEARRLLAGERDRYNREKRYVRKDGSEVSVSVTVSLARDVSGAPVRFVSVIEDITERRRAEDERRRLLAAEEAARAIAREREQEARVLAAIGEGIALVDHDGIIRIWNPAAERITGLPTNRVVGQPAEATLPGWGGLRDEVPLDRPSEAATMPIEVDGRELWLSIVGVQSSDGVVYAFRDLTAQQRLDEARTELVATVSHELRTPLSAVYGAAKTLRHRGSLLAPEERITLLDMIVTQSDQLVRLADEFLLATRLEGGDVPVARERVDVAQLVRETKHAMVSRLPEHVRIELDLEEDQLVACGDREKIRQVVLNLLDNAIKYSPNGGPVRISVERRDLRVRLAVQDRGLGIPRSEQGRVFDKFYRVDPHLADAPGGAGLGLYICRELVQRMEGRIGLDSAEGQGSTFFIELPHVEFQPAEA